MKEYIAARFGNAKLASLEAIESFLADKAAQGYSVHTYAVTPDVYNADEGQSYPGETHVLMERGTPEVPLFAHLTEEDYDTLKKATDWLNSLLVGTELSDKNDSRREGLLDTKVALWQLAERASRL